MVQSLLSSVSNNICFIDGFCLFFSFFVLWWIRKTSTPECYFWRNRVFFAWGRSEDFLRIDLLIVYYITFLFNYDQSIVLEYSFFVAFARYINLSLSMLYSSAPLAFIKTSITPVHLSIAIPHICFIVTLIDITSRPGKYAITIFLIISILSLIFITIPRALLPKPLAISQSIFEISLEIASIWPIILSISWRFPIWVKPFIDISVCKLLYTFSIFQTLFELSLIPVSVYPNMNSISICLSEFPLSYIRIPFSSSPHPRSMFHTINPFTLIKLSVRPGVSAYSFRFTIYIIPLVDTLIGKFLIACPMFIVILPIT